MSTHAPSLFDADRAVLVLIDVQAKLWPLMGQRERLLDRCIALARGARLLGVPILLTEQNPRGLGATVEALLEATAVAPLPKSTFSCFGDDGFRSALEDRERSQILVAGIEAHICVAQTAIDGRRAGYEVFCAEDAVSSRLEGAAGVGLARMRQAGVVPVTVESVLLEGLRDASLPGFKGILGLVKEFR